MKQNTPPPPPPPKTKKEKLQTRIIQKLKTNEAHKTHKYKKSKIYIYKTKT